MPALGSVSLVGAYSSTDGGQTWSAVRFVSPIYRHNPAGSLRAMPLPSAEIDASGRVYVVWSDCRFRTNCAANDIVLSTSSDGLTWSSVARIPIDDVASTGPTFQPSRHGRATIRPHPPPRLPKDVTPPDPVIQRVKATLRGPLGTCP